MPAFPEKAPSCGGNERLGTAKHGGGSLLDVLRRHGSGDADARWVVWSVVDVLHGYGWNGAGYPFFERGTVNLIPFQTFALDGHSLYILAGNVVMFLPFGFFPGLLRSRCSWRWALAEGLCITLGIECWQLLIGRAFDVDDLLLNTLGVLCGYGLARLLDRLAPGFVQRFRPQSDLHEK